MLQEKLELLTTKKQKLDSFRPLPAELVKNLEEWFQVELTYTSNAIEGNTLSRQETALVVEKGITVQGKTLREHLEAINHVQALEFIKNMVRRKRQEVTEKDVLEIHRLILKGIDETNAGRYRAVPVRIAGATVVMPNPVKVPDLMEEFITWLQGESSDHPVKVAADSHLKLVSIHPFVDGNGRTARLLMNLLLMQQGYPSALIRKEDRLRYLDSISQAQTAGQTQEYYLLIYEAVERSLEIYLDAVSKISAS